MPHRTSAGVGGLTVSRSCRSLVGASCPTGQAQGQVDCLSKRTDESLVGCHASQDASAGVGGLTVSRSCRGLVGASCPTGQAQGQVD